MFRSWTLILVLTVVFPAAAQDSNKQDKNLDIQSSVGDLHMGSDADARRAGLPLYPGARLKPNDGNNDQANLSVLTEAFGMKLVVAQYLSDDAPGKIIAFYRDRLKKYGKVLECHSRKHSDSFDVHEDEKDSSDADSREDKPVSCEESSGPVTELKVGTENNQHIVAVEPADSGKGSHFALVYVRTRGKRADI